MDIVEGGPVQPVAERQMTGSTANPLSGPKTSAEHESAPQQPNRSLTGVLLLLLAMGLLAFLLRGRIHFDWHLFASELERANPLHLVEAIALILSTSWLRSWRWAVFLAPIKRIRPFSLLGTQFMGFAAVALFGRLADLTRPYLVSRKTGVPLATQIAVYTVERIFDLGAVAILFSTMLFFTPAGAPHHAVLVRAGLFSVAGTLFLILFAVAVRMAGEGIAASARRWVGPRLGEGFAAKILSFRAGLRTVASVRDLALTLALSVAMWLLIAEAYVQSAHTFPQTATLSALTLNAAMPLLAASMGGSLLQLPIVGWFTQIAITAAAMHTLYGTPIEDATACGAVLLIANTLSVIPVGLALTRSENLSLRTAAKSSAAEGSVASLASSSNERGSRPYTGKY